MSRGYFIYTSQEREILARLQVGRLMICEGQGDPNSDGCGGQGYTGASGQEACPHCFGVGVMTIELARALASLSDHVSAKVFYDECLAHRRALNRAEASEKRLTELLAVLEPFAIFGADNVDEDGWSGREQQGSIDTWFGPSEFRAARNAFNQTQPTGEEPAGLSSAHRTSEIQALGAAISRREWSEVEMAYAVIRDARP